MSSELSAEGREIILDFYRERLEWSKLGRRWLEQLLEERQLASSTKGSLPLLFVKVVEEVRSN